MIPNRHVALCFSTQLTRAGIVLFAVIVFACTVLPLHADEPVSQQLTTQPSSQPAGDGLAPPAEILTLLESDDPEQHLKGFAAWYDWRSSLADDQKSPANRYLSSHRWLSALGDETLYDMENRKRRLSAYKLLGQIDDPAVMPYFLWGATIDPNAYKGDPSDNLFRNALLTRTNISAYVRAYLKEHGDLAVLEHVPEGWYDVREAVQNRSPKGPPPKPDWVAFTEKEFAEDLSDSKPAVRRLAIRALTTRETCQGVIKDQRYAKLLSDTDPTIKLTALQSLAIMPTAEARGLIKRIVDRDSETIEMRRAALYAIANCGKAAEWSAEWMIDSVTFWSKELDETVIDCIVILCPAPSDDPGPYIKLLKKRLEAIHDERTRHVVEQALQRISER